MGESVESIVKRTIANLQFVRAEMMLCAPSRRRRQAITHVDRALANLQKLAPNHGASFALSARSYG